MNPPAVWGLPQAFLYFLDIPRYATSPHFQAMSNEVLRRGGRLGGTHQYYISPLQQTEIGQVAEAVQFRRGSRGEIRVHKRFIRSARLSF